MFCDLLYVTELVFESLKIKFWGSFLTKLIDIYKCIIFLPIKRTTKEELNSFYGSFGHIDANVGLERSPDRDLKSENGSRGNNRGSDCTTVRALNAQQSKPWKQRTAYANNESSYKCLVLSIDYYCLAFLLL